MAAALKDVAASGFFGILPMLGIQTEKAKEDAEKQRKEQEVLAASQKKELEDIEKGQALVKEGQQKSQQLKAGLQAKGGREGTVLGVSTPSTSGPAPIKTLLGS